MRPEHWVSVLDWLVRLTDTGGGWQTADQPGVYVLDRPSGWIVVRSPGTDPDGLCEYAVEIRDLHGEVRAGLSIPEPPLASSPPATIDTAALLDRARRLVTAIEECLEVGEDLAEAERGQPSDPGERPVG